MNNNMNKQQVIDNIMMVMFFQVGKVYKRSITQKNDGYLDNEWTEEEEQKFRDGLIDYVRNNSWVRKTIFGNSQYKSKRFINKHFVSGFLLSYGGKTKYEK